jgi:glycosyltransferase involved in cell wall biosynthesis
MICQDVRVDRRIILQAQSLTQAGYDVSILGRAEAEGPITMDERDGGIPVRRIRVEGEDPRFRWLFRLARLVGRGRDKGAVNIAKLWGAITAKNTFNVLALPVAIRTHADVYHAHDLNNLPIAYRAATAEGAKLAYDAHEMFSEIGNSWVRVRRGYWRRVEARLLPMCHLATTVNEFIAEEMARRYHVPPPEVIYNCPRKPEGFDPDTSHRELYDALELPADKRIVLYQGWLGEGRGIEEMVLGAEKLPGQNAVLVLMGYGELRSKLEELVADKGMGDAVRFKEPVPQAELINYCASATVGIIPYRPVDLNNYYSSPNKLFDFIQAGTPILANDLPFLRKVIVGRDIGMVAQMTTPDSVGQVMVDILKRLDESVFPRWKENLKQAATVYNWEHEAKKLVRLYSGRIGVKSET